MFFTPYLYRAAIGAVRGGKVALPRLSRSSVTGAALGAAGAISGGSFVFRRPGGGPGKPPGGGTVSTNTTRPSTREFELPARRSRPPAGLVEYLRNRRRGFRFSSSGGITFKRFDQRRLPWEERGMYGRAGRRYV